MFSVISNLYVLIGCAFVFLWYYSRFAYNFWRKLNVKYVEPVPFLGNTYKVLFQLAPKHEDYQRLYRILNDEPFGGIYEFLKPQLLVKDPKLVSAILVKDFHHFRDRGFQRIFTIHEELDPLLTHLLFTRGDRWKVLRQKMSPIFTSGKLKHMHEQVLDCINLLIKYIDQQIAANDSFDVALKGLFEKLTIDVIGSCAFGIDCNALKSNDEFGQMGRIALRPSLKVPMRMLLATISQRLVDLFKIPMMSKEVKDFFVNLTLNTIKYRRENGVKRSDLVQLLMELQNSHNDPKYAGEYQNEKVLKNEQFNEIDIAANAFLFFIAGFETTATTLSYCLYELALNQNIQEKLRSEVKQVKDIGQLTYENLRDLTYMDAVISETLRKYPPAPVLNRECTEDYLIPETEIQIPAGTVVTIPVWSIQHDWKNYPNPEIFDPERFFCDKKHSQHNGTFLAFGDGPRYCLGKRFAEMEMKAALSAMILKYDVRPCSKTEIPLKFRKGGAFLQTTCGNWVNLSKRKD